MNTNFSKKMISLAIAGVLTTPALVFSTNASTSNARGAVSYDTYLSNPLYTENTKFLQKLLNPFPRDSRFPLKNSPNFTVITSMISVVYNTTTLKNRIQH